MNNPPVSRTELAKRLGVTLYQVRKHLFEHIKKNPALGRCINENNRLGHALASAISESINVGFVDYFERGIRLESQETQKTSSTEEKELNEVLIKEFEPDGRPHIKGKSVVHHYFDWLQIVFADGNIIEAHESTLFNKYFHLAYRNQYPIDMESIFDVVAGKESIKPLDKVAYVRYLLGKDYLFAKPEKPNALNFVPALIGFATRMNSEPVMGDALESYYGDGIKYFVKLDKNGTHIIMSEDELPEWDTEPVHLYPLFRLSEKTVDEYLILDELYPNFVELIHEVISLRLLDTMTNRVLDSLLALFAFESIE